MAAKEQGKQPAQTNPSKPAVEPQITIRGNKVLQHHLFESSVTDCLKNVSYTPGRPDLKPNPHKHFFHTIDSRGKRLAVSSIILNHWHNMEWGMDPATGKLFSRSGPPMVMKTKHYPNGDSETLPEQVQWFDAKGKAYIDTHTHTWEYVDTEEFTPNSLEARRKANQAEIGPVQVKPMQAAEPFNASDPATLVPTTSTVV